MRDTTRAVMDGLKAARAAWCCRRGRARFLQQIGPEGRLKLRAMYVRDAGAGQ